MKSSIEFCPPLDGSLIAALLADAYSSSEPFLGQLKENLRLLAHNADEANIDITDNNKAQSPSQSPALLTASAQKGTRSRSASASTSQHSIKTTSRSTSSSSAFQPFPSFPQEIHDSSSLPDSRSELESQSQLSSSSFTSPFGFLRSIFPDTAPRIIESALASAGWVRSSSGSDGEDDDVDVQIDMDAVVNSLLSEEFIAEIIERGYVPGEEGDPTLVSVDNDVGGGFPAKDPDRRAQNVWELAGKKQPGGAGNGNVDTNGLGPRKGKRIKSSANNTITLGDVRQRKYLPSPSSSSTSDPPSSGVLDDPWVYAASIATQLHRLVPQSPYSSFLALFHNPSYGTPIVGVRTHLAGLARQQQNSRSDGTKGKSKEMGGKPGSTGLVDPKDINMLVELVSATLPSSTIPEPALDAGVGARRVVQQSIRDDAHLCLGATRGNKEDAYDLLCLLKEMERDALESAIGFGGGGAIIHSPAPSTEKSAWSAYGTAPASSTPSRVGVVATGAAEPASIPLPTSPTPAPRARNVPPSAPVRPQQNSWQTVNRKGAGSASSSNQGNSGLAAFIPAYQPENIKRAQRARERGPPSFQSPPSTASSSSGPHLPSRATGKPTISAPASSSNEYFGNMYGALGWTRAAGAARDDEADRCRAKADEIRVKRDDALRQAASHWQRRKHGKHGGEVSFYYAEQARKLDAERRQWSLEGARAQVSNTMVVRTESDGRPTIDLHGLTVNEGIVVSKENLDRWWKTGSGGSPVGGFTIITGAGRHSVGATGVLGPAVQKALEEDGWIVRKEYAKLVVVGLNANRRLKP